MRQGEVITTSLISMEKCQDIFESNLKEGKDILYISFSSALSGTYNAALMVAKIWRRNILNEKYMSLIL